MNNPALPAWSVIQSAVTHSMNTFAGTIVDDIGHNGTFRPCTHRRTWVSCNASLSAEDIMTGAFPRYYGYLGVQTKGFLSHRLNGDLLAASTTASLFPAGGFTAFEDFITVAKSKMMPSLSDGNSVINFIYELKDFKKFGSRLLRAFNAVGALRRRIVAYGAAFWSAWGSLPWDSKPKKASKGYLAWRFAWQPFVSDCKALLSKLLSLQRRIKQFIRGQKQKQQRYFGKNVQLPFTGGSYTDTNWSIPPGSSNAAFYGGISTGYCGVSTRRQEYSQPTCRLTATMRYNYTLPASVSSMEGRIRSYLDILGVNANPAIIWNAIPFSFVVDWFVNIGGFLERIRVDNIYATTTVTQLCASARAERNYVKAFKPYMIRSTSDSPIFFNEVGIVTRNTHYERKVFEPSSIGVWLTPGGGLTGDKVSLAAALAHANLPQKPRAFVKGLYLQTFKASNATELLTRAWAEK